MQGRMIRYSLAAAMLLIPLGEAMAQAAPPAASPAAAKPVDPALAAAQASFEALPESERKAIQTDLIWGSDFSGTASGSFGSLTFNAIKSFQRTAGIPPDGILTAPGRKGLADTAKRARDQARFAVLADPRSGAQIGVPQAVLTKPDVSPSGMSRWQSADGMISLEMRVGQPADTLEALFEKAVVATPTRKITYKLLRPDFYVVTGETQNGRYYIRMAKGPQGLRGFSVAYDKSLAATSDKLVIAIANSFDPFPSSPLQQPLPPKTQQPVASLMPPPVAKPTERLATGLQVGPTSVVTGGNGLASCKAISANGRQARVAKEEAGLVLLTLAGASPRPPAPLQLRKEGMEISTSLVILSLAETAPGKRGTVAIPADSRVVAKGNSLNAPLQPGGGGSPIFDRNGALAGFVIADPASTGTIAGILPQRSYDFAGGANLEHILAASDFAISSAQTSPGLTTGQIVDRASANIVSITCTL